MRSAKATSLSSGSGAANCLGFAVQLCYLRFPDIILSVNERPFPPLLRLAADQLKVGVENGDEYSQREPTWREHLIELQTVFGLQSCTTSHYRQTVQLLTDRTMQIDKSIVLASALIEHQRRQSIITESGLKITSLNAAVFNTEQALID